MKTTFIRLLGSVVFVLCVMIAVPQSAQAGFIAELQQLVDGINNLLEHSSEPTGEVMGASTAIAFPGAKGFGANTTGARGQNAKVCVVTNRSDSGPGSFRACAEQSAPAYITFATSGYIDLNDEVDIASNKTIECATAPGDGVVFRRGRLHVQGDNIILRGCRAWAGDSEAGQSKTGRDGITVGRSPDTVVHNAIVANSSMMWSTDELGGTWYPVDHVTFQDNIFAWALRISGHVDEKNPDELDHSMGHLLGDNSMNVSSIGNFLAFNEYRNPQTKGVNSPAEVINNLVFCWGNQGSNFNRAPQAHAIGNVYKSCPMKRDRQLLVSDGSTVYLKDNTHVDGSAVTPELSGSGKVTNTPRFTSSVTPMPSSEVEEYVKAHAGPVGSSRLAPETRAFNQFDAGTGSLIDSQTEVGGYPALQSGTAPADSDSDGMPNDWEQRHCGGSCSPSGDVDGDGYENIEEYFHSFYAAKYPTSGGTAPAPAPTDTDSDGIADSNDNCPLIANAGQADADKDGTGDACDSTPDGDVGSGSNSGPTTVIEAESGNLNGFSVASAAFFSGGARLQAESNAPTATYTFPGQSGAYSVSVAYCDEDDGQSAYSLSGSQSGLIASWSGDRTTGTTLCNTTSLITRTVASTKTLAQGETLTLSCTNPANEQCRVDAFTFVASSAEPEPLPTDTDADGIADTADNCPSVANAGQADSDGDGVGDACDTVEPPAGSLLLEAESGALNGFSAFAESIFSGGARLQAELDAPTATYVFPGQSGAYDVSVTYCDEDDGQSQYTLSGSQSGSIATWSGDRTTGSTLCDSTSLINRTIATGKVLANNETLTLSCTNPANEQCRIDVFKFVASAAVPDPTPLDTDHDGVADADDNCPLVANASQTDTDSDGTGDACDSTPNGDPTPTPTSPFTPGTRVMTTDNLNVRDPYGLQGAIVGVQAAGSQGTVLDIPAQAADGYLWIPVNFDNGVDGWVASDFLTDEIAGGVTQPDPITVGDRVATTDNLRVHDSADLQSKSSGMQKTGSSGRVINGPVSADGYSWFKVDFDSGKDGWVAGEYLRSLR